MFIALAPGVILYNALNHFELLNVYFVFHSQMRSVVELSYILPFGSNFVKKVEICNCINDKMKEMRI